MKFLLLGFLAFLSCNVQGQVKPFTLGVVDQIYSPTLSESRIINIYLPEGYKAADSTTYPVIYLLDGSADEDFIHISGLVQFASFEWVNLLPKTIVVGIANVDRKRDFTFPTTVTEEKKAFPTTGGSQHFISFLEKELKPYIADKYHGGGVATLIGESLGGLLATQILLEKPDLFDRYIIVSPSLWWDSGSILQKTATSISKKKQSVQIYIGVGKEGLTPGKTPRVMEVDAFLLADKLKGVNKSDSTVYMDYLPRENHASILHQAVLNAFHFFHGDYK